MDLNTAITQFAKRVRPLGGDRAMVRTELDPNLGLVAAGPEQIDWMLVKLAADAHDGTPGGGELTISTSNVELHRMMASEMKLPPGEYVRMQFEAAAGAMDVGAAIRTMVQQMRGAVVVRTTGGPGLVADILLPRAMEPAPAPKQRPAMILVVSDDPASRKFTCDLLKEAGYQVVEAAHGKQAEDIMAACQVDLMITDVVMPERDGLETILSVKVVHPGLKIIAVAESPGGYQLRMAKLLGADSVMSRPLTPAALCDAVRDQIGGTGQE